jgi:hypothetical protein
MVAWEETADIRAVTRSPYPFAGLRGVNGETNYLYEIEKAGSVSD